MSTSDHSKFCPGSICEEASRTPAICCCGFFDAVNEEPRCEKCGAELTTGAMALFCPRGRECEFYVPEVDEFRAALREYNEGRESEREARAHALRAMRRADDAA